MGYNLWCTPTPTRSRMRAPPSSAHTTPPSFPEKGRKGYEVNIFNTIRIVRGMIHINVWVTGRCFGFF